MKTIAIFASGTGSNATKIVQHFEDHPDIRIGLIVTNRAKAGVLDTAETYQIPALVVKRTMFYDQPEIMLAQLEQHQIDFIALAGFLWLVPAYLVRSFRGRMTNIHPALLPDFGGPGMYGMHVHRAVVEAGVKMSGMTIHYVNEQYDEGATIFQAEVAISPEDDPEDVQQKVLALEHAHYPLVLERLLSQGDSNF